MAFTIEEIEKTVDTSLFQTGYTDVKKSANYAIVTEYLTGQSKSLAGIIPDMYLNGWDFIPKLLSNIETIDTRNQLVLDVINDPVLHQYVQFYFKWWLIEYALNHTSDNAFQAVLRQYRQMGMTDDDIFQELLARIGFQQDATEGISNTALKTFLLRHIQKSAKLIYLNQGHLSWNNEWSLLYFQLLEEIKSPHLAEYIAYGVYCDRSNPILFLSDYKDGTYMPALLSFITDGQHGNNINTLRSKFRSALIIYESDKEKFSGTAIDLANQLLEHVKKNRLTDKWEVGFHLKEFVESDLSYLPYSSCAFHVLLTHQKENALQILTDWSDQKIFIHKNTLALVYHHLQQDAFPFIQKALELDISVGGIDYYQSALKLLQSHFPPEQYIPIVWSLINNKSKPLRTLVANIIAEKDKDAESKAVALLKHKSADTRQAAATILSYFNTDTARKAIMDVLHKESNDNARDILLQLAADSLPAQADDEFVKQMIAHAAARGKLSKPVEDWLDEAALPALYDKDGNQLPNEATRFLLYRMSRVKAMHSDPEAKYIIQQLDREKAAPFALELIKLYKDKGAKPEYKYLVAVAALLGNDAVVDKIRTSINNWIDENRYKMAEHGVGALALHGSDKALRWVEWYSRKYRSKKANVGAAALVALEIAAEELGITTHELGDRIVPDFGFDGLFKHFTADGEEYRAFIDSNFKIAFFNEDNKKLKSIPASADAALKEEFKAIAKEVRDVVKSQSPRLEYYLIIQRRWSYEQWQKFFLQNPVMFIYATKLVWGSYSKDGQLQQTFLCNDDTTLINVEQEEIIIDENAQIGIVHPTQLTPELLQQWKTLLYDLSVETVFPQLDRKLADISQIDLSKKITYTYDGRKVANGYTRSTLERYGWHKGPVGDGGMIESFNLLYYEKKIEAVLEVEGIGAGYGWGGEEKLGRLYVVDKTNITGRRIVYVKDEHDAHLVKLQDVPVIFLSEMLAAIDAIKNQD